MSLTRGQVVDNQAGRRAGGISALGPVETLGTKISGNVAPVHRDQEGQITVR